MPMREAIKSGLGRFGSTRLYEVAVSVGKALDVRRGAWTEPELKVIPRLVRTGDLVVDVGSNYGMWSYHLARAVGPSGQVRAFEPIPPTARASRRLLRLLGVSKPVTVSTVGVGEQTADVRFSVPIIGRAPSAQLARMTTTETDDGFQSYDVRVVRLDDEIDGAPTFMKVDVEGAELFALRGAERLISEHKPAVVCEIGAGLLKERYGIDVRDLLAFMADRGYRVLKLDGDRLADADVATGHDGNYLFVQPGHLEALADLR